MLQEKGMERTAFGPGFRHRWRGNFKPAAANWCSQCRPVAWQQPKWAAIWLPDRILATESSRAPLRDLLTGFQARGMA